MKVGRNDLCPCGSGKKFKKCHYGMPPIGSRPAQSPPPLPPHIIQQFHQHQLEENARVATYGEIRPIIHIPDYANYRFVVVRNRVYYMEKEKWKFFTDFLLYYGLTRLGKEWFDQQKAAAPADQHPAYVWRNAAYAFMGRQEKRPDGSFAATPNGTMAALIAFYYDLYIVHDNSLLDDALLERLKHRDQFQGALHELFAEATCLRAGFTITRENERDGRRRHVEFMAVHKLTGQHLLVEAKSRHRAGVMGRPGQTRDHDFRFRKLISDAIKKDPNNPLAIFVDTNLPPDRANRFYLWRDGNPPLPSPAMASIIDKLRHDYGGVDPYNVIVFSNHPQHYSADEGRAPGNQSTVVVSQQSRVRVYHEAAMHDMAKAVSLYGNVPTLFPPPNRNQMDPNAPTGGGTGG
jgi:uncharacterized protein YchJ